MAGEKQEGDTAVGISLCLNKSGGENIYCFMIFMFCPLTLSR
jgi:hypothetical protein